MSTWKTVGIILAVAVVLAFVAFVFMSTWGCQPGNIHLQGMC